MEREKCLLWTRSEQRYFSSELFNLSGFVVEEDEDDEYELISTYTVLSGFKTLHI